MLVVGAVLLLGVSNSLNDVLIPQFRKAFQLERFRLEPRAVAFFFGYF